MVGRGRGRMVTLGSLLALCGLLAAACGSDATVATAPDTLDPTTSTAGADPTSPTSAPSGDVAPADPAADDLGPLVRCEDVPVLSATIVGSLDQFANPDPEVMGVLATYGLDHPDVFAGFWIDRDQGGALVVAVTDEPAAHLEAILARGPTADDVETVSPRPPVADPRPLGDRSDVTIDVVQAEFTEAELLAANERFWNDRPPYVLSGGIATTRNRISLDLIDPTAAHLADLAQRVPLDMTCVEVISSPTPPAGALDVLPDDDTFLTCGAGSGPGFRPDALDDRTAIETLDHEAVRTLQSILADPPPQSAWEDIDQPPPVDGWYVLAMHDATAIFGNGTGSPITAAFLSRESAEDGWRFDGWTITCTPTVSLPPGLGHVQVTLDPSHPRPAPGDTIIHLLVTERACVSGRPMGDRLRGPQVRESDDEIVVAFAVALLVGPSRCPGNPPAPATVELASPVGSRPIRNGLRHPAPKIDFPGTG
ncbi:MAG: hypothetical protein AAGK32_07260 [Actinomycetota bacterium]